MHWIDPDTLPETTGIIDMMVYNPHGEVDGFVLDGGRLVHVPPHLGALLRKRAKPGQPASVWAIKPRAADVLAAVAVRVDGKYFVDDGPEGHLPADPPATTPADVVGSVRLTLFAPRGEVCGAVLEDGTLVRLHPKGNAGLAEYFEAGRRIEVWGPAFRKAGVQVVEVEHVAYIAESEDEAQSFADERSEDAAVR
jgi:hypothetical protein